MKNDNVLVKYLKDYQAPAFKVDKIDLEFDLHDEKTFVKAVMQVNVQNWTDKLILDGEELELKAITINGNKLVDGFEVNGDKLTISNPPKTNFELIIENIINPLKNTALDGLYKSGGIFCTQNEPEGFRRITYFIDRPDNLSVYTTKIIADKKQCPILLSNGNLIEEGDLPQGKHFAKWADPFPKPAYLYALVAGDLGLVQDKFTTKSGRVIDLRIYVDKGNESKCHHAMESLKNSMKWDEDRFGLEYDLDIYMVVAVDAFNMGAMENKGLNIFNSAYVLADKETATDENFYGIESVIGHEYFHNWTGNRVTCRDWFQLTLKEGLTVYRDQEFSADLNSRPVCRIKDVSGLRSHQFTEDAGPTAHPIKPKSYIEMNNFYTATVYEKGAEVIRMIATILGRDGFRKGMDKYFELFDGGAVTTEDFVHAMSVANNNYDFSQFKLWYDQAGTPKVQAKFEVNSKDETVTLSFKQSCKNVGGETIIKKPFHLPIKLGLVDENGHDVKLSLKNRNDQNDLGRGLVHLKNEDEVFVFEGISRKVVPSINREFSAPIKLETNLTEDDLAFLMAKDSDEFNRYESLNTFAKNMLQKMVETNDFEVNPKFVVAFGDILKDQKIDHAFKALCLTLPAVSDLVQDQEVHNYEASKQAVEVVKVKLATTFKDQFVAIYDGLNHYSGEFKVDATAMGERKLKNTALGFLSYTDLGENLVKLQYKNSTNMTDRSAALSIAVNAGFKISDELVQDFYNKFKDQTLVMQKWLSIQANSEADSTFDRVNKLLESDIYDKNVPNLVRSLIGVFARNLIQFNHKSGRGIKFVSSQIKEIDKINPQVASRLASAFRDLNRMPLDLRKIARAELEEIVKIEGLSKNVYEIVSKTLA